MAKIKSERDWGQPVVIPNEPKKEISKPPKVLKSRKKRKK